MGEKDGFEVLAQQRTSIKTNEESCKAIQHAMKKLTARERLEKLLDPQSFVETGAFAQHSFAVQGLKEISASGEGVVTGYGTIDGRGVYVFAQDYGVLGGSLGAMQAKKIIKLLDRAGKTGLPVIALPDSMGARIGEGTAALEGFGLIYKKMVEISGVVPIITAICGKLAGTAAFFAPLSDFVFMAKGLGGLYTAAPGVFAENGKEPNTDIVGGANIQSEKTGLAHFVFEDEDSVYAGIKQLLGYIPDNNLEDSDETELSDDPNRMLEDYKSGYDIRSMLTAVADGGAFMEAQASYGTSMITGFARLGGRSTGFVANAPGTYIDTEGCDKSAGFIYFCDAFGIPVVTFTDTPGFVKDIKQEQGRLINAGAKLMHAYAEASVPLVNVITGSAIGTGYVAMSPKALGADMVYAWPEAVISCLSPEAGAIVIMNEDIKEADKPQQARKEAAETFAKTFASPWEAAKMGYVDEVIYPSETRQRICGALELAYGKRENKLPKKHGTKLF